MKLAAIREDDRWLWKNSDILLTFGKNELKFQFQSAQAVKHMLYETKFLIWILA